VLVLLAACVACSTPGASPQPLQPDRYSTWGDTLRFGEPAIRGVDPHARSVELNLRTDATIFIYAIDPQHHLHAMAACFAPSGPLVIKPTLATERGIQISSTGGVSGHQWTWRVGYDAMLIILIDEEPRRRVQCDQSGNGAEAGTMHPSEALRSFPRQLRRYQASVWASYLVEP